MQTWISRVSVVLCSLLASALLTGCVAHREALNVNKTLGAASAQAQTSITALKQAVESQQKAYLESRRAYRELLANYEAARRRAAEQALRAEYQVALTSLEQEVNRSAESLWDKRQAATKQLDEKIQIAFQPLADKMVAYKTRSEDAAKRAAEYPRDSFLAAESKDADRCYLTTAAYKLDRELDTRVQTVAAIDQAHQQSLQRLHQSAQSFREKLQTTYNTALEKIKNQVPISQDLGPDPVSFSGSFDGLIKYAETVGKAADGNCNYLQSNWFGTGSYFADFFGSFGRGFLGGVIDPSSVKNVDPSSVASSWKDLESTLFSEWKGQAAEIVASYKASFSDYLSNLPALLSDKVKDTVARSLSDQKLQSTTSNPTNSNPL